MSRSQDKPEKGSWLNIRKAEVVSSSTSHHVNVQQDFFFHFWEAWRYVTAGQMRTEQLDKAKKTGATCWEDSGSKSEDEATGGMTWQVLVTSGWCVSLGMEKNKQRHKRTLQSRNHRRQLTNRISVTFEGFFLPISGDVAQRRRVSGLRPGASSHVRVAGAAASHHGRRRRSCRERNEGEDKRVESASPTGCWKNSTTHQFII